MNFQGNDKNYINFKVIWRVQIKLLNFPVPVFETRNQFPRMSFRDKFPKISSRKFVLEMLGKTVSPFKCLNLLWKKASGI